MNGWGTRVGGTGNEDIARHIDLRVIHRMDVAMDTPLSLTMVNMSITSVMWARGEQMGAHSRPLSPMSPHVNNIDPHVDTAASAAGARPV